MIKGAILFSGCSQGAHFTLRCANITCKTCVSHAAHLAVFDFYNVNSSPGATGEAYEVFIQFYFLKFPMNIYILLKKTYEVVIYSDHFFRDKIDILGWIKMHTFANAITEIKN